MDCQDSNLRFNLSPSSILHIDLNSCFATIEQQANIHLRGRPVAVAAYTTPSGCIIAPSVEAKKVGVKVGMRVKEGKLLCPELIVLPPDPWKYRNVHLALRQLVSCYTSDFSPKSIDEFSLNLKGYPCLEKGIKIVAREIKRRIKKEVGEAITVSIGVSTNRFLAKLAAGLHKPDGLDEINKENFLEVYGRLKLMDLPYIKCGNSIRLFSMGIFSVLDFYNAPLWKLKAAFASILGYYWYLRLRGWEIDSVDFARRSYGNSYALPRPLVLLDELSPIISKLVEKTSSRLRAAGYKAKGVHVAISYKDHSFWHKGMGFEREFFDSRDIYKKALYIMSFSPRKPVREVMVSVFNLVKSGFLQLEIFDDVLKKDSLTRSLDEINNRWGKFVVTPARVLLAGEGAVPDRIAFGGVKELEEFMSRS